MKDITNYLEKPQVDVMLKAAATSSTRDYLVITFTDVVGIEQNPVFDLFGKISEIQSFLYEQIVNARMGWQEL
ncbi:MAG: hypothetical protein WCB79_01705 [Halobacteriota archaeon]